MRIDLRDYFNHPRKISLNRSKSLFIRYLIYYYLKHDIVLPIEESDAEDVKIVHDNLLVIQNEKKRDIKLQAVRIDVKDCGSAYRFFTSLLSVKEGGWLLTGTPRLLSRPLSPLIDTLRGIGASITLTPKGVLIVGKMLDARKAVEIDCRQSSQFASSLMLVAPFAGIESVLLIPQSPPSFPYIEMTREIIDKIDKQGKAFHPANIENDWSAALFWYAALTISDIEELHLPHLKIKSLQGDSIIAGWMTAFGIETIEENEGILIRKAQDYYPTREAVRFNVSAHPDTAPVLAALAILTSREMILEGVRNLNFKESKRLDIIREEFSRFARIDVVNDDLLHIKPFEKPHNQRFSFHSHNDHRFVMAFLLFALQNVIEIDNLEPVKKSYPNLLKDLGLQD